MRPIFATLLAALMLTFAGAFTVRAAADVATGLPTGKRKHKPFTLSRNWSAYRPGAQRLKDARQRRAALKLIQALRNAKRKTLRAHARAHRLQNGRRSGPGQHGQSNMAFLKERARGRAKGTDMAMEELTIAHEGLAPVRQSYNRLRQALGIRTNCVRKCDVRKRQCDARCHRHGTCACVVAASDCLLSEIRARRCTAAMPRGWPSKFKGPGHRPAGRRR